MSKVEAPKTPKPEDAVLSPSRRPVVRDAFLRGVTASVGTRKLTGTMPTAVTTLPTRKR